MIPPEVVPPQFLKKVLPKWLRTQLRPHLEHFNAWLFEKRARLMIDLARQMILVEHREREIFERAEAAGIHVVPVHYYSPIPELRELRNGDQSWRREVDLSDVRYNFEEQARLSEVFKAYQGEVNALPDTEELRARGYGLGYGPIEAMLLHCFIRNFRPKRIVEVGSGVSTFYEANAIALNAAEGGAACELTCIEPYPSAILRSMAGVREVIPQKVQNVALDVFQKLGEDDILFIDSSHSVRIGSDVNYLFLEVLPALRPGVLIHIHDICLPHVTPTDYWVFEQLRFWQEGVVLKALLSGNRGFEIVFCQSYLHQKNPALMASTFPAYDPKIHYPQSIWLRRRANEAMT